MINKYSLDDSLWLFLVTVSILDLCECFFGLQNKTNTFSKKPIENIQCI